MKFTVVHQVITRCIILNTYLYTSKAHLHIVHLCVNVRTNTCCLKRNRRWPDFAGALVCSLRRDLATSRAERHVTRNARCWCDDRRGRPTALNYTSTEMIRSCRTQVLIAFTSCTVLFLLLTHASYRESSHSSLVRFQPMASRVAASLRNETGESSGTHVCIVCTLDWRSNTLPMHITCPCRHTEHT